MKALHERRAPGLNVVVGWRSPKLERGLDMAEDQTLEEFAQRYADAWGSHDPAQVASF